MDEATSNLDAHSESLVLQAIDRLAEGRTTFIIAHRLSVARDADTIIALAEGQVAETGTHDELLDLGGVYAGLYERQVGVVS
jgi:ATP-binding cassette subfamily B protein